MIKSLLKSGVFWTLVITTIITSVIIFVFPFFFEAYKDWTYRLLIAFSFFFVMTIFVLLYIVFLQEKTQKKLKEYKEKREEEKAKEEIINEKIKDIKFKFNDALKLLKQSTLYKNKRRARYELPWYLLVGKEQEGKTTLLEASGLDFPLNINYEHRSVKEEGSSKGFLWYFAEHAIFIDMPGQYINQTIDESDSTVWEKGFLKLFAKKRLRRPLNGIILNISVNTFIEKSEKELEQYAKDLRDRFDELSDGFVSSIPIYLIITKSDNMVGYNEYFASLSEEEKEEVLGITFDDPAMNVDTTVVRPELEKLLKRINSSIIDKLHHEWDEDTRTKIFLFPDEFSSIFEKIGMFTDICFAQTRYRKSLMLRGIYFTSVPEDQEAKTSYLLSKKDDNKLSTGRSSRGHFIKKLLQDVIFPESDLIKMDENFKKINKKRQTIAIISAVAAVVLFALLWISDFVSHNNALHELEDRVIQVAMQQSQVKSSDSYEKILPILNEMNNIKTSYEHEMSDSFYRLNFYDVKPRTVQLYNLYQNTLANILLPRVANSLNDQILSNLSDYKRTWSNTEIYLMLHDEQHRKKEYLQTAMGEIWAKTYPNKPGVQKALNMHLKNLLNLGFKPYSLNQRTLKTARSVLYNKANVVIVYDELRQMANEKTNLKPFSFEQVLGANVDVFKGNSYQIPGLYTKQGFEKVIVVNGQSYIKEILQNNWVLGTRTELTQSELDDIYAQVLSLYFKDYKRYWIDAISDLNVPQLLSESGLRNQLEVLSLANSPIVSILQAIKTNTNIYTPEELLLKKAQEGDQSLSKVAQAAAQNKIKTSKLVTNIKTVRSFFKQYHDLLKDDGTPAPNLENAMLVLNKVFQQMNDLFASVNPQEKAFMIVNGRVQGKVEPIVQNFSALPLDVNRWFRQTLNHSWDYLILQMKDYIQAKYEEDVWAFYQQKIQDRYPFHKSSQHQPVRLEDLSSFFKSDGIFDSFFKTYIQPFVEINKITYHTYKSKNIDGRSIDFNLDLMKNILRAFRIRNIFFSDNGQKLSTTFYLTPRKLDSSLATMELDYAANKLIYEHGAVRDTQYNWPVQTPSDMQQASYRLYDISGKKVVDITAEGDWALFKLMDKLNVKTVSNNVIEIYNGKDDDNASISLKGNISNITEKDRLFDNFKLSENI